MAVTMLTPLVLVIITGLHVSEEHVSLMSHVSRQTRDTSQQCGPHSYACAGTPRCVLSSQVLNIMMNVNYSFSFFVSGFSLGFYQIHSCGDVMHIVFKWAHLKSSESSVPSQRSIQFCNLADILIQTRLKLSGGANFSLWPSLPPLSRPHGSSFTECWKVGCKSRELD